MAQDGGEMQSRLPMPVAIAKAVLEAIKKIESAEATGEGEEGTRAFKYASINDVLAAAHAALNEVGLHASPVEAEYTREFVEQGQLKQLWAHYGYKFRLIHKDGASWIDEDDVRHISIALSGDGMRTGKAQSLAMRDYYKGLLRIRTAEPDDEGASANGANRPAAPPKAAPHIKGTIPMTFVDGTLSWLPPKEIEVLFAEHVASLGSSERQEWADKNKVGLDQLQALNKPMWLRLRKTIEQE